MTKASGGKVAQLRAMREASAVQQAEHVDPQKFHADRIEASWRESVAGIIETGRRLLLAKEEIPHGEWGEFVAQKLPFNTSTARRLMEIAQGRLSNEAKLPLLPPSWTTLYQLTKLGDEEWTAVKPHLHAAIKGSEIRALTSSKKKTPAGEGEEVCPTCGRKMPKGSAAPMADD